MTLLKYLMKKYDLTKNGVVKRFNKADIFINDHLIKSLDDELTENDQIKIADATFIYHEYCYLKLNKPSGYLSSNKDEKYPSLLHLVPSCYYQNDLNIVGRLDQDTEGLILLTNDGAFLHHVTHPKTNINKKYFVRHINKLKELDITNGITFSDYKTKPINLEIIDDYSCYIEISEGKYHEVKRIINYLGSEVSYLKRIAIGSITLDDLPVGGIKELTKEEINSLK